MKHFNITGICDPLEHYMVDVSDRIHIMEEMIESGKYISMNRGRQYGKTTTLALLEEHLSEDFVVYSISFEGMDRSMFETADRLAYRFLKKLQFAIQVEGVNNSTVEMNQMIEHCLQKGEQREKVSLDDLSVIISKLCKSSEKPVILIIDEVDKASEYESFLDFLGLLRSKYLKRKKASTFQSVILASVYNIKNLKLKVRPQSEHQYNSPWNIAEAFEEDMSFSRQDIRGMLIDYEEDHHTGMDLDEMSGLLYDYTSGYPFLVSKLCRMLDEESAMSWNRQCFLEVLKRLLSEENTLFDDMAKKLQDFPEMEQMFYGILYNGYTYPFVIDDKTINIAFLFGYIKNVKETVHISNRIFETRLYNLFFFKSSKNDQIYEEGMIEKNQFVKDGHLDMERILEKFIVHYNDIYGNRNEKFHEKEGRKFFMFYLKPIINGIGNYYVEAETRDETKTDLVVDYHGEQFVIEMKIWRGDSYNKRGEEQLISYMNYFHVKKGYMLSFNFNKNKVAGLQTIELGDKTIVEAVL